MALEGSRKPTSSEEAFSCFSVTGYHLSSSGIVIGDRIYNWMDKFYENHECIGCQRYFDLEKEKDYLFGNNYSYVLSGCVLSNLNIYWFNVFTCVCQNFHCTWLN